VFTAEEEEFVADNGFNGARTDVVAAGEPAVQPEEDIALGYGFEPDTAHAAVGYEVAGELIFGCGYEKALGFGPVNEVEDVADAAVVL